MFLEPLDARRLFASVSGTVWTDTDNSGTFDSNESPIANATVYVDANSNGRLDAGETTTRSDADGKYSFQDLPSGKVLIGVLGPTGDGETTPGPLGASQGGFDIQLTGLDSASAVVRKAFAAAAARWESIITGDLKDVGKIDDIRIAVTVDRIDGVGGTLAQSEPDFTRAGSDLPYTGDMEFDQADIQGLIDEGHLVDTITHEMAHVLGFGTIWDTLGLIRGSGTKDPEFLGKQATAQYDKLFDTKASTVPVENSGGDGTADGHWPEDTFVEELMTGFSEDAGVTEPLSTITAASMADLGYTVNLRAADTWDPLDHTTVVTTPLDLGARAFEREVTLNTNGTDATDANFGFRADTAPTVGTFTAGNAILGKNTTLSASNISDAEGDSIAGVSFYAESNGIAGLQSGKGGDVYLGGATSAKRGVWTISGFTGGLAAGSESFYAVATDALGLSGRRTATATLTAPPPPTRPNPIVATAENHTTALLQWKDRSDDEIGFRIEISTDPQYSNILRAFNVQADSVSTLLTGLTHLTKYYVRVRSYGYGGASAYTRLSGVRV